MAKLWQFECKKTCYWGGRHFNEGQVFELSYAEKRHTPPHFRPTGKAREQSKVEVRCNEIQARLRYLAGRYQQLKARLLGGPANLTDRLNSISSEVSQLELELDGLTGR